MQIFVMLDFIGTGYFSDYSVYEEHGQVSSNIFCLPTERFSGSMLRNVQKISVELGTCF